MHWVSRVRRTAALAGLFALLVPLTAVKAADRLTAKPQGAAKAAAAAAAAASTMVRLNRLTIDTAKPLAAVAPNLSAGPSPTSWIVQLNRPSTSDQVDAIKAAGLRVVA